MAESVFARPTKPRMRQQRNNSVTTTPDPNTDESQLSIVPDEDEPALDTVAEDTSPTAAAEPPAPEGPAEPPADDTDTDAGDDTATTTPTDDSAEGPSTPAGDDSAPQTGTGDDSAQPDKPAKTTRSQAKKPTSTAGKNNGTGPATKAGGGAALAVINPDGSVTVDPGTHLIDLRDVAGQDDPHALVDMLGELRTVTDSDLRQHVTAEISAAITAAALN